MGSKISKKRRKKEYKEKNEENYKKIENYFGKDKEKETFKEKEKDDSEWDMDKNKYYSVSKMEMKTKLLLMNEYILLKIFPNGNILISDYEKIKIYDSKTFKQIFTFQIDNLRDLIILSNNSLLLNSFSTQTSINTIQILNFSKDEVKLNKFTDIKCSNNKFDFSKDDYFEYNIEFELSIEKLNKNRILFYHLESLENHEDKDNLEDLFINYRDSFYTRTEYKYHFIFYRFINNNLIQEFKDSHILAYFEQKYLPYEDSFFLYGNSNYCYLSNPMVDIHFLYFYKNKKMECIKDGIEHDIIKNCIIFKKKYLIIQYISKIEKYLIDNEGISLISKYCNKNLDFLMMNKSNLIFIRKEEINEKTQNLYFLEVDEKYQKIKEERISVKTPFKEFFFYKKKLYILSENLNIYY